MSEIIQNRVKVTITYRSQVNQVQLPLVAISIIQLSIIFGIFYLNLQTPVPSVAPLYKTKISGVFRITKNESILCNKNNFCPNFKNTGILRSKWIKLFPILEHMIRRIESKETFPTYEQTTSTKQSYIEKDFNKKYKPDELLNVTIHARDHNGKNKEYGGDYFVATLHRNKNKKRDNVSCDILDHGNGIYTVQCMPLWSGIAVLEIRLIDSSESVYLRILSTNKFSEPYYLKNNSFINSQGEVEYGICDMNLSSVYKNKNDICDHSNPRNEEPWFCVKPKSGECAPIHEQLPSVIDRKHYRGIGRDIYYPISNHYVPIKKIFYFDELEQNDNAFNKTIQSKYNKSKVGLSNKPESPTGWHVNGVWKSFLCRTYAYRLQTIEKCFSNKTLYFMGDSTMYQIMQKILEDLTEKKIKEGPLEWPRPRTVFLSKLNLSLIFRAHGSPFHIQGPPTSRPYISDSMDAVVNASTGTHIFFSIGVHLTRYHPDIYIHRIYGIIDAIKRLHKRLPNILIYVFGLHSDLADSWVRRQQEILLRTALAEFEFVSYIPFWDMLFLQNNRLVHPRKNTLNQMFGVIQSHLCYAC